MLQRHHMNSLPGRRNNFDPAFLAVFPPTLTLQIYINYTHVHSAWSEEVIVQSFWQ